MTGWRAVSPGAADRQRMAAEGVSPDAARPGTVMPDTVLLDAHGAATSLRELRAGRHAVIVSIAASGARTAI